MTDLKRLATAAALALAAGVAGATAETAVERGEYLVRGIMGCGNCHTPFGADGAPDMTMELAGRLVEDIEPFTAYAPNITSGGRIAEWSDAELARAIREGIRPDGSLIGPPMPYSAYRNLSDDDLAAVVAYLRTTAPVDNTMPASEYRIPLPPAYGPPVESVSAPARGVTAEYGGYLAVAVAHCMECHSGWTPMGPDYENALGQGGFEFHGPWGTSVALNLTSHPDGLADYSDDEIEAMIVQGTRPDGSPMLPPMPYGYLAQMSAEDLDAIVLYLRGLPPLPGN